MVTRKGHLGEKYYERDASTRYFLDDKKVIMSNTGRGTNQPKETFPRNQPCFPGVPAFDRELYPAS